MWNTMVYAVGNANSVIRITNGGPYLEQLGEGADTCTPTPTGGPPECEPTL